MRMLLPKRAGRETGASNHEAVEALAVDRAETVEIDRQNATKKLGGRQELLGSTLDEIGRLTSHLKQLDHMVAELRNPLEEELSTHKRELSELITTRALLDQTADRLQQSREAERTVFLRVTALEHALGEAQAERHTHDGLLQDADLEIDRLRTTLAETEARAENASRALRDATLRMRQLEEDMSFLRKQGQEDDGFRREIDGLLAKASQDLQILEEEAAALRRRLEQATSEAFRLSNTEVDLQSQLTNERARMITLQTAAERAQAELLQLKGLFEEQAMASQTEVAGLSTRLETAAARANRLESLNADLARKLSESATKHRNDERRLNEVHTAGERISERVVVLEEELLRQRNENGALERARLVALERSEQLSKRLQSHELTMRRAEERLRDMQAKLEAAVIAEDAMRHTGEQAAADAGSQIERLRADLAIAEAALMSAHEERGRQHLASLAGGHHSSMAARELIN